MEFITAYSLPSISAISIKLLMFWYGRKTIRGANSTLWMLLGGLLGVNIAELILFGYAGDSNNPGALVTLTMYYVFVVISGTGFVLFSLQLADFSTPLIKRIITVAAIVTIFVTLIPGAGLAGAKSIGYSVTRVAGPYYWILQINIIGFLLASISLLIYTVKKGNVWIKRRRATAMLIGSLPTTVATIAIVTLMQLGFKINATVISSLTFNILLAVLIYTEYEYRLFRFLSFIPSTSEFKLTNYAIKAAHRARSNNLREAIDYFERALINDTLVKCGGNKTATAEALGVSRATLRRKLGDPDS